MYVSEFLEARNVNILNLNLKNANHEALRDSLILVKKTAFFLCI